MTASDRRLRQLRRRRQTGARNRFPAAVRRPRGSISKRRLILPLWPVACLPQSTFSPSVPVQCLAACSVRLCAGALLSARAAPPPPTTPSPQASQLCPHPPTPPFLSPFPSLFTILKPSPPTRLAAPRKRTRPLAQFSPPRRRSPSVRIRHVRLPSRPDPRHLFPTPRDKATRCSRQSALQSCWPLGRLIAPLALPRPRRLPPPTPSRCWPPAASQTTSTPWFALAHKFLPSTPPTAEPSHTPPRHAASPQPLSWL